MQQTTTTYVYEEPRHHHHHHHGEGGGGVDAGDIMVGVAGGILAAEATDAVVDAMFD